jgi:hypothetical protein
VKKPGGAQEHKDRLRARLRVQQRHQKIGVGEPREPPLWKRKDFSISTILALIALILAVPSIFPKVTASFEGTNSNGIPSFKISNEGLLGLNNVSAICRFVKVDYFDPGIKSENNTLGFTARLDTMSPGQTALVICPPAIDIRGSKIRSASLKIEITFRPDFSFFHQVSRPTFVSEGDLSHWTPPHLY